MEDQALQIAITRNPWSRARLDHARRPSVKILTSEHRQTRDCHVILFIKAAQGSPPPFSRCKVWYRPPGKRQRQRVPPFRSCLMMVLRTITAPVCHVAASIPRNLRRSWLLQFLLSNLGQGEVISCVGAPPFPSRGVEKTPLKKSPNKRLPPWRLMPVGCQGPAWLSGCREGRKTYERRKAYGLERKAYFEGWGVSVAAYAWWAARDRPDSAAAERRG